MQRFKALLFDAYGTLFDVQSLSEKLANHFGSAAEQINQIWRKKQLEYTWLRSLMKAYRPFSEVTAEALEFACRSLGITLEQELKVEMVQGYYELAAYPEVRHLIPEISQQTSLAILSNADPAMLHSAVENSHLQTHFHKIFSVDAVGRFKPDPAVYQLALHGLGMGPSEVLFVSSNTWDVNGAASAGLKVAWLKRGNQPIDRLSKDPDYVFNSLVEIKKILI